MHSCYLDALAELLDLARCIQMIAPTSAESCKLLAFASPAYEIIAVQRGFSVSCETSGVSVNLDFRRSRSPYLKNRNGKGVIASRRKAIRVPAHVTPSLRYCRASSQRLWAPATKWVRTYHLIRE